jgi:hypothetical protein
VPPAAANLVGGPAHRRDGTVTGPSGRSGCPNDRVGTQIANLVLRVSEQLLHAVGGPENVFVASSAKRCVEEAKVERPVVRLETPMKFRGKSPAWDAAALSRICGNFEDIGL